VTTAAEALLGLTEPLTIERAFAATTFVEGRAVAAAATTFVVEASIQPATDRDLAALPELERTKDTIKIYLVEELKVADDQAHTAADAFDWRGQRWRIVSVSRHGEGVLDHHRALAQRSAP